MRAGNPSGIQMLVRALPGIFFILSISYICCSLSHSHDVALRWHGNRMPEQDTEHETVGKFYLTHREALNSSIYFDKVPSRWRGMKGRLMVLEIVIDLDSVSSICFV